MRLSRRSFAASSLLLLAGCNSGASPDRSTALGSEATSGSPTETSPPSTPTCTPPGVDSRADRTKHALDLYETAYDGLDAGASDIGVVMESDGLYVTRETGGDANVPEGLRDEVLVYRSE